jgi:glutaredoxin/glutathione-dependent peroxiredoxin
MTIAVGDRIPATTLINQIGDTVRQIDLAEFVRGKRVVIVGMPGAYTQTCSAAHLPSFIRTAAGFRAKGIDEVICIAVNDVRVMNHWGRTSGAEEAGVLMLADWNSEFTKAVGLEFSVPGIGFKDRLTRCAMVVEDGVVQILQLEESKGTCDLTAGETLLEMI